MPDDLSVQLAAISARLRELADGGLTRRLSRAIGKATEPLEDRIFGELDEHMPNRYADVIRSELNVFRRTYTDRLGAQVTIYARTGGLPKRKIRRLDDGILWHPLFGRFPRRDPRNKWYEMGEPHVKPGWFSGPAEQLTPQVRDAIARAVDDAARELMRRR